MSHTFRYADYCVQFGGRSKMHMIARCNECGTETFCQDHEGTPGPCKCSMTNSTFVKCYCIDEGLRGHVRYYRRDAIVGLKFYEGYKTELLIAHASVERIVVSGAMSDIAEALQRGASEL